MRVRILATKPPIALTADEIFQRPFAESDQFVLPMPAQFAQALILCASAAAASATSGRRWRISIGPIAV